jgi:hypothetical protein
MSWSTVVKDPLITLLCCGDGNRHSLQIILFYVMQLPYNAALHIVTMKTYEFYMQVCIL